MAPSRKPSNGRSPLVNPQRQITSFFNKTTSPSPSPSPTLSSKQTPKSCLNPNPNRSPPSPGPSPSTPSPLQSKPKKPLLVIGQTPSPSPSPSPSTSVTIKLYGKEIVEKRIKVYWPLDKSWYEGYVKSFDEKSGKHLIQYDDSEEELLDLGKEKIEFVEESIKKFKRLRKGSLDFKRKTVIESEEMEDARDIDDGGGSVDDNDDSSDEDWIKNVDKEDSGEVEVEDDEEEDGEEGNKKRKPGWKGGSRKRKASGGVQLNCGKKTKSTEDISKGPVIRKESE